MKAFCDNDILHKLCAFDLLEDATAGAGLAPGDLVALPTAKFFFLRKQPDKGRQRFGDLVYQRIHGALNAAGEVGVQLHPEDEKILINRLGIDQGEALLFSYASRDEGSLLTGDKRSLLALTAEPSCSDIVARLQGRVVCLEQLVLGAIARAGFVSVRERIVPAIGWDKVMRVAFGSGLSTEEGSAVAALEYYVADLRKQTGSLLRQESV